MLKNTSSVPVEEKFDDIDLLDQLGIDDADLDLGLDLGDEEETVEFADGLGALGVRRRGRRRRKGSRARRRRGARARRMRRGRRGSKKSRARASRRRAKRATRDAKGRFIHFADGLGAGRKRRRRKKKGSRASSRRRRKAMAGLSGIDYGMDGMGEDFDGLSSLMTLGEGRKTRRRKKKGSRARRRRGARARRMRRGRRARRARASRRRRGGRKSRRSRRSGMGDFASLAEMSAQMSDADVASSMPVVGPLQWLGTRGGLEAFGGVSLGALVSGLVNFGLFKGLLKMDTMSWDAKGGAMDVAQTLVSSIAMWELGKLIGSGGIAKFGALYAIGDLVNRRIVRPYILKNLFRNEPALMGLGQSGVFMPGDKRPDYAVNPLSGFGTVRIPDTEELKDFSLGQAKIYENQDLVGLGTVRVADDQGIGTVRVADDAGIGQEDEDEVVGQFDEEMSEESEVF